MMYEKENIKQTHYVLEERDISALLNPLEQDILGLIYEKINKAKTNLGKKEASYQVVSSEEPYSDEVYSVIYKGELEKKRNKKLNSMPLTDRIGNQLQNLTDTKSTFLVEFDYGRITVTESSHKDSRNNNPIIGKETLFDI